jgi:hypothetical protein
MFPFIIKLVWHRKPRRILGNRKTMRAVHGDAPELALPVGKGFSCLDVGAFMGKTM